MSTMDCEEEAVSSNNNTMDARLPAAVLKGSQDGSVEPMSVDGADHTTKPLDAQADDGCRQPQTSRGHAKHAVSDSARPVTRRLGELPAQPASFVGYGLQVAGCGLQVAGCGLQVAVCGLRGLGLG